MRNFFKAQLGRLANSICSLLILAALSDDVKSQVKIYGNNKGDSIFFLSDKWLRFNLQIKSGFGPYEQYGAGSYKRKGSNFIIKTKLPAKDLFHRVKIISTENNTSNFILRVRTIKDSLIKLPAMTVMYKNGKQKTVESNELSILNSDLKKILCIEVFSIVDETESALIYPKEGSTFNVFLKFKQTHILYNRKINVIQKNDTTLLIADYEKLLYELK
jgi:hypothetical protein